MAGFETEQLARVVQFVTGTSGVPSQGFAVLQVGIGWDGMGWVSAARVLWWWCWMLLFLPAVAGRRLLRPLIERSLIFFCLPTSNANERSRMFFSVCIGAARCPLITCLVLFQSFWNGRLNAHPERSSTPVPHHVYLFVLAWCARESFRYCCGLSVSGARSLPSLGRNRSPFLASINTRRAMTATSEGSPSTDCPTWIQASSPSEFGCSRLFIVR